jgi:hypothetical protein
MTKEESKELSKKVIDLLINNHFELNKEFYGNNFLIFYSLKYKHINGLFLYISFTVYSDKPIIDWAVPGYGNRRVKTHEILDIPLDFGFNEECLANLKTFIMFNYDFFINGNFT